MRLGNGADGPNAKVLADDKTGQIGIMVAQEFREPITFQHVANCLSRIVAAWEQPDNTSSEAIVKNLAEPLRDAKVLLSQIADQMLSGETKANLENFRIMQKIDEYPRFLEASARLEQADANETNAQ